MWREVFLRKRALKGNLINKAQILFNDLIDNKKVI